MTIHLPTALDKFAAALFHLTWTIGGRTGWSLTPPLITQIANRIIAIKHRVAKLAALVQSGRYAPRKSTAQPRQQKERKPRPPSPLPSNFGWLLKMVPETVGYRSNLENLLGEPEMAALMAAAPAALRRPIRSLCRMLAIPPPAILALPKKPRPPRKPRPKKPELEPEPPRPPLDMPAWMRLGTPRKQWSLTHIRDRRKPA